MATSTLPDPGRFCNVCGARFESNIKHKRTCSPSCAETADRDRSRAYQRRRRQMEPSARTLGVAVECAVCGQVFQAARSSNVICSRQCRNRRIADMRPSRAAAKFASRACVVCGTTFVPGSYQQAYCTTQCRRVKRNQDKLERRVPVRRADVFKNCKECDAPFSPRDSRQYLCSVACNAKVQARIGARTRRARLAGVRRERIDPVDVFRRDGYRCGICGRKTLASKRGTDHPRAPELDHIVAIALGGSHTFENVQCSCSSCNRRKGAAALGQLHLFPAE